MKPSTVVCRCLIAVLAMLVLSACVCTKPAATPAAAFALHQIYGSHMLFQRHRPIPVSGTATPGGTVKIEFAGVSRNAVADAKGEWRAEFPALPAGGPHTLTVTGGEGAKPVQISDILIGELWFCSGQSNMEMPVKGGKFWSANQCDQEVAAAQYPGIRLFKTPHRRAPGMSAGDLQGGNWQVCTPDTVAAFSATAYFFGRQLHRDLNVPVGLIQSAWGGTRIEPWISETGYRNNARERETNLISAAGDTSGDLQTRKRQTEAKLKKLEAEYSKKYEKWIKDFYNYAPAATAAAKNWSKVDLDDSGWKPATLPEGFPDGQDGIAWFRHTLEIPAAWAGKDLTLRLGPIDDCDETFFNGEQVGATDYRTPAYWQHSRVYRIPGKLVKPGRAVIAVRVADHAFNGGLMGNRTNMMLELDSQNRIAIDQNWKIKLEYAIDLAKIGARPEVPGLGADGLLNPSFPATLYNGMVAAWIRLPVRGVIWYQGCSNAGSLDYYPLHQILIRDWRRAWNQPDMPFLLVQLAGYEGHTPKKRKPDGYWKQQPCAPVPSFALTREIQAEMLRLPNVGMAVTMDIGDHSDIHPGNKQTVGYRLAKEAERIAYSEKIVSQGPKFKSMKIEGNAIRVTFDNVANGLATLDGQEPGAFALAGSDGKFVWADARIDGNTVLVTSPAIKEPKQVRYAWAMYRGDANLSNRDGFAAIPFRSDKPEYR